MFCFSFRMPKQTCFFFFLELDDSSSKSKQIKKQDYY